MRLSDFILKEELVINDTLNPAIWNTDTQELLPEVKKAIVKIADTFIEFLKIDKSIVKDIILTGSNVNYNYTKDSDVDIHIEVDTSDIKFDNIAEYFITKKTLWNLQHNISIHGYPVELYAEPNNEKQVTNAGIYSISKDEWIVKPVKFAGKVDQPSIDKKFESIKGQIEDIIKHKVDNVDVIQRLKDNIKNLRKTGIEKGGEYSTNNLTFKELRNGGYLEKLSNYAENITDKELSLK